MSEFDFLRQHGFGVVYGAEAVRNKIIELKGNTMNDTVTVSQPAPFDVDMVEVLDEQGNPTGQYVKREGEAAQAEAPVAEVQA